MLQHFSYVAPASQERSVTMKPVAVLATANDQRAAHWLIRKLSRAGYDAVPFDFQTTELRSVYTAVVLVISPSCGASAVVAEQVARARQTGLLLIPAIFHPIAGLPWFVDDLEPLDFVSDAQSAFDRLRRQLAALRSPSGRHLTFGEARDAYLQRATLRSPHTLAAYRRSIELFMDFLNDQRGSDVLPLLGEIGTSAYDTALSRLGANDAPIFLHFAQWLLSPGSGKRDDRRPYRPATVELRLSGILSWFQFLDDHGWLPAAFQLAKARRIVRDELRAHTRDKKPPRPPEHLEEVIYYYDTQQPPAHLRKPNTPSERIQRWELTRLRNRALLHSLAETGGRISELLSLNLADFPVRALNHDDVLRVEVVGKGGHTYYLRFYDALPAIRAYIEARGANLRATARGDVPLFVSHDPRYEGRRMSRIVAWRVVQRAARALGLGHISPHDFRHWRATQLINAGHPLDVVQEYLGHRSVETTRAYYAHTDPLRVDDAVRDTGLPAPDGD